MFTSFQIAAITDLAMAIRTTNIVFIVEATESSRGKFKSRVFSCLGTMQLVIVDLKGICAKRCLFGAFNPTGALHMAPSPEFGLRVGDEVDQFWFLVSIALLLLCGFNCPILTLMLASKCSF